MDIAPDESFDLSLLDFIDSENESSGKKNTHEFRQAKNEESQFGEDGQEQEDLERQIRQAHVDGLTQERELKKEFSDYVLNYLKIFSVFCVVVIFLQGSNPKFNFHIRIFHYQIIHFRMNGFKIGEVPFTTLIGSTAVSAIGLVAIVLNGLFKVKKDEEKGKDNDQKPSN